MGDQLFNVMGMIVVVAGITAVVSRPNSAAVIRAMGEAFGGAITSALGR